MPKHKKEKKRGFEMHFRINLETSLYINATTFEEALDEARSLKVTDVIDLRGSHNDSAIRVCSAWDMAVPMVDTLKDDR